ALIEATQRLNVYALHQSGALTKGACTTAAVDPRGCLAAMGSCLTLTREADGLVIEGGPRVAVIWQAWRPGRRERPMFECPLCGRPCRDLFFGEVIGCRLCLGLRYRCRVTGQPSDPLYRAWRKLATAPHGRKAIAAEIVLLERREAKPW